LTEALADNVSSSLNDSAGLPLVTAAAAMQSSSFEEAAADPRQ
jgi:hypothetical protein